MDDQKKVWNNIAPSWNKHRNKISSVVYDFLKLESGKVLDVGCGSGRNFIPSEDLEFYGIDFSNEMIRLAEQNAKEKNINARLQIMNATDLDFSDEMFDICVCNSVLHCIKDKEERIKIVKEIYRVLKKDGKALISVWSRKSPRLKNANKECEIPWSADNVDEKRYTYIYELEELIDDLHHAGFKVVKYTEDMNINAIVFKGEKE